MLLNIYHTGSVKKPDNNRGEFGAYRAMHLPVREGKRQD